MLGSGYNIDMGPVMGDTGLNGYDADDEVLSSRVVHKGDKVMIQSKLSGKLLLRFLTKIARMEDKSFSLDCPCSWNEALQLHAVIQSSLIWKGLSR